MPPKLHLLVVEDDEELREDLAAILRAGGLIVDPPVGTGREAEDWLLAGNHVDVGLVDLGLPDCSGIELIARLKRISPNTAFVVFTVFDAAETVFGALSAGAVGYLLKSTPPASLTIRLVEAADGGAPMTASVARLVVEKLHRPAPEVERGCPTGVDTLSARELEVLQLLAKGVSYGETARLLGVALGTIQTHVKAIYRKLDVSSKAEAAALAVRAGLSLRPYGSEPVSAGARSLRAVRGAATLPAKPALHPEHSGPFGRFLRNNELPERGPGARHCPTGRLRARGLEPRRDGLREHRAARVWQP